VSDSVGFEEAGVRFFPSAVLRSAAVNGAAPEPMINMGSAPMKGSDTMAGWVSTGRTLAKGDYIMNELGVTTAQDYEAQICRPITIGQPTKEFQRTFDIVKEVFDCIVKLAKPGARQEDITDACNKIVQKSRFRARAPHTHGIGLSWERPIIWPDYSENGVPFPSKSIIFEPNITFVVHIWAQDYENNLSVALGDSVLVTEKGCEFLTKYEPRGIIVK
jgi:Xaa-Pro aminopeptidase